MLNREFHVVQQNKYCQVNLQKVLGLIVKHLALQLLQEFLAQWDEQLVDCDVVDLKVHDGRHRYLPIVWTPLLLVWNHPKCLWSCNGPGRLDYAACHPEL